MITSLIVLHVLGTSEAHGVLRKTWQEGKHWYANYCRASLLARDLILTHDSCLKDKSDCEKSRAIFWNEIDGTIDPFQSRKSFSCAKIIESDPVTHQVLFATHEDTKEIEFVQRSTSESSDLKEDLTLNVLRHDRLSGEVKTSSCLITKARPAKATYETNCSLEESDLGLLILNEKNEALGMAWGSPKNDSKASIFSPLSNKIMAKLQTQK